MTFIYICEYNYVHRKQVIKIVFKYQWTALKTDHLLGHIGNMYMYLTQDTVTDHHAIK